MSVRSSSKKATRFVIMACGALALGSSAARASDAHDPFAVATEHATAMSRGHNHEEARVATLRAESARDALAQKHAEAMSRGKTHEEARAATFSSADASRIEARAKRHLQALNAGDTHEQARVESDEE